MSLDIEVLPSRRRRTSLPPDKDPIVMISLGFQPT